ncbi:thymidine kinase [Ferrimonas sediminicola]|uniref:Thymidine kinase n=1 Tax=Ferrimonas sediminicola TaxID=2569538 RepID=A0A4U1BFR1_9GAMM|nr:thymidine kinase [Ferrimonas sediminicola]TKB49770.1 thymidine kinase [Ferrimonas sediminicola]
MAQLYFYYSAMNAGKSTSLLQSAYNYRERGMEVLVMTAGLDDRYGLGKVTSRIGLSSDALIYRREDDLLAMVKERNAQQPVNCLLVDECQFLTKAQVRQLTYLVDKLDIPVLCYGLRTDFQGELFEGSHYLLAWADKLVELKTICHCGRKANMVVRMDGEGNPVRNGDQVHIGGNDSYVSMCRTHYRELAWD